MMQIDIACKDNIDCDPGFDSDNRPSSPLAIQQPAKAA